MTKLISYVSVLVFKNKVGMSCDKLRSTEVSREYLGETTVKIIKSKDLFFFLNILKN
jgi:hypothetical protein